MYATFSFTSKQVLKTQDRSKSSREIKHVRGKGGGANKPAFSSFIYLISVAFLGEKKVQKKILQCF